jgi:hypothetical protein
VGLGRFEPSDLRGPNRADVQRVNRCNHPEYQIADLLRNSLSPNHSPRPRGRTPIQFESSPMPADHSFRAHEYESLLPTGPKPARQNPEDFIERSQGLGCFHFGTASCCRRTRFSNRRVRRAGKHRKMVVTNSQSIRNIGLCYRSDFVDFNEPFY